MGAGGIGGIVAATLTEVGVGGDRGLDQPRDPGGGRPGAGSASSTRARSASIRGWVSPAPEGKYDLCILATQPPNVEDAARTALPHLADDAAGRRAAERPVRGAGRRDRRRDARDRRDRRVGRVDARARPLRAHRRGRVPDRPPRRASSTTTSRRVAELLEAIGPVTMTQNLRRRAVEQARAQLRGLGARHDRRRAARPARAGAPLSPARARDR